MSAKIFASLGKGVTYPFKHLSQWLLLTIVFIAAAAAAVGSVTAFAAENTALGIVLIVVGILIELFACGVQVKLYGRKEKIFSFPGNIGRGFQLFVITLIYQIISVIIFAIICAAGAGATIGLDTLATATAGSGAIWGAIAGLGVWGVLILILIIFFSIFMMPALVNFAVQGKFGAAFHFKEIFAMIGQAKWYKILLGILVLFVAMIILCVIIGLIVGLFSLIPVAGSIIGGIIGLILAVGLFFVEAVFWAEMFNPENQ